MSKETPSICDLLGKSCNNELMARVLAKIKKRDFPYLNDVEFYNFVLKDVGINIDTVYFAMGMKNQNQNVCSEFCSSSGSSVSSESYDEKFSF